MKILYDESRDFLRIVLKEDEGVGSLVNDQLDQLKVGVSVNNDQEVVCVEIENASTRVDMDSFSINLNSPLVANEL